MLTDEQIKIRAWGEEHNNKVKYPEPKELNAQELLEGC